MNKANNLLHIITLVSSLALSACGGGGGGSSSSPSPSSSSSSSSSGGNASYSKTDLVSDVAQQLASNYNAFSIATNNLATAATSFCSDTSSESEFGALQENWFTTTSSWQLLQAINFGPADDAIRRSRIAFYPVDRNQLETRINDLIAGTEALDESAIAVKSVDLQGLVALEQILFRNDALATLNIANDTARYCELLQGISANLVTMAGEINALWVVDGSYHASFTSAENTEQSLEDLFGGLVENFEIIENNKLRQPSVGNSGDIESPLAKSSMDNISANLNALEQFMFMGEDSGIDLLLAESGDNTEFVAQITTRINTLKAELEANDASVVDLAATTEGAEKLNNLAELVRDVIEKFASDIANALNVFIGFNGADGD